MNQKLPSKLFLLSPWTDLTGEGRSIKENSKSDPYLSYDNWLNTSLSMQKTVKECFQFCCFFASFSSGSRITKWLLVIRSKTLDRCTLKHDDSQGSHLALIYYYLDLFSQSKIGWIAKDRFTLPRLQGKEFCLPLQSIWISVTRGLWKI